MRSKLENSVFEGRNFFKYLLSFFQEFFSQLLTFLFLLKNFLLQNPLSVRSSFLNHPQLLFQPLNNIIGLLKFPLILIKDGIPLLEPFSQKNIESALRKTELNLFTLFSNFIGNALHLCHYLIVSTLPLALLLWLVFLESGDQLGGIVQGGL